MHTMSLIIGICWIVFWIYWIISAFGAKKGTYNSSHIRQFVGIRLFILILVAISSVGVNHVPQSFKNYPSDNNGALLAAGLMVFLLGLMLAVWARIYLGKNWGMPMTLKNDPELVTTGPYRYIRHPIYSGLLLMILGSALDVNYYWSIVFVVALVYFVYSSFAEEATMAHQFPKAYPAYKSKTKMLIPFVF